MPHRAQTSVPDPSPFRQTGLKVNENCLVLDAKQSILVYYSHLLMIITHENIFCFIHVESQPLHIYFRLNNEYRLNGSGLNHSYSVFRSSTEAEDGLD